MPCAIMSSVSPGATVIGVPPSQVHTGGGGGGGAIEPVTSAGGPWYEPGRTHAAAAA